MGKIEDDTLKSSETIIIVFGIIGNILVILSILGQKKVLKSNYFFLVLHLSICDLAALIFYLFLLLERRWFEEPLSDHFPMISCHVAVILKAFQLTGVGMMIMISLYRYQATVHPLKLPIGREKLTVVCGLLYLAVLTVGVATGLPLCWKKANAVYTVWSKLYVAFGIFFRYFVPTIFMTVVYYKIGRELTRQSKLMKRFYSNATRQREPDSFDILRYTRNRRTFLVCLGTVLCYSIAVIPKYVWYMWEIAGETHLRMKYGWVEYFANIVRLAGTHSVHPLMYGISDKRLLTFWKACGRKKRITQGN